MGHTVDRAFSHHEWIQLKHLTIDTALMGQLNGFIMDSAIRGPGTLPHGCFYEASISHNFTHSLLCPYCDFPVICGI